MDWEALYKAKDTGWDIGYPSTPIKNYIDQLPNKSIEILMPGAGNAHEAEYLFNQGFAKTHIIDIAPSPIEHFKSRVPTFPDEQIFCADFFKLDQKFDLIIEQTFFCALHPSQRNDYVTKMHELLKPNGKLVGLLFNDPLNTDRPPYGGNPEMYKDFFSLYFDIKILEPATNSIEPRAGRELFFVFQRK